MSKLTRNKEFERKFWVLTHLLSPARLRRERTRVLDIRQAFLSTSPNVVRVRISDGEACLEIKGARNAEYGPFPLPLGEAEEMMAEHRVGDIITKKRHELSARFGRLQLKWEVDAFRGANAPLVFVEIETPEADTPLDRKLFPDWVGDEITGDPVFDPLTKNKNLATNPFRDWPKRHRELAERHMRERLR